MLDPHSASAAATAQAEGRSRRGWVGDLCFTGFAATGAALILSAEWSTDSPEPQDVVRELALGVLACAAVWLVRRRWPVQLALALLVGSLLASTVFGAGFASILNVAMRRSWLLTALIAVPHVALIHAAMRTEAMSPQEYREGLVFFLLIDGVLIVSGMLVRSQRLLVGSLRDRARQAEEKQRLRIEEARRLERERIAREMHDVLAHRISLLAVHAGALEYRPDAPAAQITQAAGVIRRCAFEALEDLREVIGVLRDEPGSDGADAERPQPTLANLPDLVGDSQRSGTPVRLDARIADLGAVPASVGRHAYRIVQEGLTNARKHSPGAEVRVVVAGAPGTELTVELCNRLPAGTGAAEIPGAGAGLIGLQERADLVGGRLEHGRTPSGDFRLWTSLPWPE